MSRVSENSSSHALQYSLGKTKGKLEDLHIKGASLKRLTKPSDDPVGNVQLLSIRSQGVDSEQHVRTINFANTHLQYTETALEDMSELLMKAKEIAIGQSSDIYNADVRKNVSMEVAQIRKQSIGIANRKIGNRYLFSGYSTLTRPFDAEGRYYGDKGTINLEINKDFFVPINLNGHEVFMGGSVATQQNHDPLENSPLQNLRKDPKIHEKENEIKNESINRDLASSDDLKKGSVESEKESSVFRILEKLEAALRSANPDAVQDLLPEIDDALSRVITLRTRIGSISQSITNTESVIERSKLYNEKHKSMIEDADIAELFTDIQKQQNVLEATYKSGSHLMQKSLLDFLR
jgi:flagellar hook-associated protein 3 FlgL